VPVAMSIGSVHYKFKSAKDYDTVTFEDAYISLGELKRLIISQKKLGKGNDFDLKVTNAQTNDGLTSFVYLTTTTFRTSNAYNLSSRTEYEEDSTLIPKNTSVIIRRVPATRNQNTAAFVPAPSKVIAEIATIDASHQFKNEEDKIRDMVNNQAAGWHAYVY